MQFSTAQKSSHLNCYFRSTDGNGMLEGERYEAVTIFSIIATFLDLVTWNTNQQVLIATYLSYLDIHNILFFCYLALKSKRAAEPISRDRRRQLKINFQFSIWRCFRNCYFLSEVSPTQRNCRKCVPLREAAFSWIHFHFSTSTKSSKDSSIHLQETRQLAGERCSSTEHFSSKRKI